MAAIEPAPHNRRVLAALYELSSALVEEQFTEIEDPIERAAAVVQVEMNLRTVIDSQVAGWDIILSSPE